MHNVHLLQSLPGPTCGFFSLVRASFFAASTSLLCWVPPPLRLPLRPNKPLLSRDPLRDPLEPPLLPPAPAAAASAAMAALVRGAMAMRMSAAQAAHHPKHSMAQLVPVHVWQVAKKLIRRFIRLQVPSLVKP